MRHGVNDGYNSRERGREIDETYSHRQIEKVCQKELIKGDIEICIIPNYRLNLS